MTALVIDASAAVHFLRSDTARLATLARQHDAVVVPSIFDYEVANATMRLLRRKVITARTTDRMIGALHDLPVTRVPAQGRLLEQAIALISRLTLADAIYLALAHAAKAAMLTIDAPLADVARSTGTAVIEN